MNSPGKIRWGNSQKLAERAVALLAHFAIADYTAGRNVSQYQPWLLSTRTTLR
jgi:hypothetical protein